MKMGKTLALLIAAFTLSPLGAAQSADDVARTSGIVNQVPSRANNTIIVGDVVYNVAKNVVVHASSARTSTIDIVRQNQKIQFVSSGGGPGTHATITEIWLQ